tara:strand:+ start:39 stop:1541 length:1503 start_codon:yes stop_codon:yes gene_type:complete
MAKTISVSAQTVSDYLTYAKLNANERTKIRKEFGPSFLMIIAAGNVIPPKTFQARTVNFEYPKDKKQNLSEFSAYLTSIFNAPVTYNKSTLKMEVQGSSKITINFKEKKDPQESRKQTPTQYQEKGTTDVFNRVLEKDKRYASVEDMKRDKKLMDDLRDTFSGKTAKKNVGDHRDKIDDWMNTFFSQQDLFLVGKYSLSIWSKFEYGGDDWVTFWSKFIKKVKTQDGSPVGDYTTWNPSDIWAVKDKKECNAAIDKAFKKDKGDPRLSQLNNLLITMMKDKQLVGISLKKIEGSGAHFEEKNLDPNSMRLAEVVNLESKDIDLQLDNIVQQEKVTTYIKYAATHTMNINLGDKKKFGNLSFNTQIKGTAAQGGQAPVKDVLKLLHGKGSSKQFDNNNKSYPQKLSDYQKDADNWKNSYMEVKKKTGSASWPSWEDFQKYIGDLYRDKKSPIAVSKLMQIDFYYDVFKNYTSDQDYADFWIALLHLGMKVGEKFAPHAKIS